MSSKWSQSSPKLIVGLRMRHLLKLQGKYCPNFLLRLHQGLLPTHRRMPPPKSWMMKGQVLPRMLLANKIVTICTPNTINKL